MFTSCDRYGGWVVLETNNLGLSKINHYLAHMRAKYHEIQLLYFLSNHDVRHTNERTNQPTNAHQQTRPIEKLLAEVIR